MVLNQGFRLFCIVNFVMAFDFRTIHSTASIWNTNSIGSFSSIEPNARIGRNSYIGSFATIKANASIGDNTEIGSYCTVGQMSIVRNNVKIGGYVMLGERCVVHDYSELNSYVNLGYKVEILENVFMNKYSTAGDNVVIGAGSILDSYASLRSSARTDSNVYLGKYSSCGANAMIGKNAVIHKYAEISNGGKVSQNEVIIATPTSDNLYSTCVPIENIQQSQIDRILNTSQADASDFLLDLMAQQFDQLTASCPSSNFELLKLVKSLYLIKCYGLENYKANCGRTSTSNLNNIYVPNIQSIVMNQYGTFINGQGVTDNHQTGYQSTSNEKHFGSNDNKNIIDARATDKIVRLIACQDDSQREFRNDNQCKMLEDIKNARRSVRCDS